MAGAALIALGMIGADGAVAQDKFVHTYEMRLLGVRGATATFEGRAREGGYFVEARARGTGILGFLSNARFDGNARGGYEASTGEASGFAPAEFYQRGAYRGDSRQLNMRYTGGVPTSVVFTPERDPDDDPIPPLDEQAGTLDPLTSVLRFTWPGTPQEICGREIDSFTGSRRTLIEMEPPQPAGNGQYTCKAQYSRTKGFENQKRKRFPFTATLRQRSDGLYEVWRIVGATDFGRMTIQRTN
ncbi:MAG: hypothetical protein AAGJ92_11255 [Pseudomonadota bacterium]